MKFFEYVITYYGSGATSWYLKKSPGIYTQHNLAEEAMEKKVETMRLQGWRVTESKIYEVKIIL